MRAISRAAVLGIAFAMFATGVAAAQTITGTVRGTVRDSQGAVVPGATVTAASDALAGRSATAVTDDGGE